MRILKNGKLVTVSRKDLTSGKFGGKKTGNAPAALVPTDPASPGLELGDQNQDLPSKYVALTVAKLKDLLDSKEIEYPPTAKKADLVELAESIVEEDESEPAI